MGSRTIAYRSQHYTAIIKVSDTAEDVGAEVLRRLVQASRTLRKAKKLSFPSDVVPSEPHRAVTVAGEPTLFFPILPGLPDSDADYLLRFLWQHRGPQTPEILSVAPTIR